MLRSFRKKLREGIDQVDQAWVGHRYLRKETLRGYLERNGVRGGEIIRVVHEPDTGNNHLTRNVDDR